jgi:glycosyltransferase involved in cell wall biosynthesis
VTIEAMKAGRPVVGAASGHTGALISHGLTGLLYRPGDAADLAAQVRSIILDSALLEGLRNRATRWAEEEFNVEKHAAALEAALRDARVRADKGCGRR